MYVTFNFDYFCMLIIYLLGRKPMSSPPVPGELAFDSKKNQKKTINYAVRFMHLNFIITIRFNIKEQADRVARVTEIRESQLAELSPPFFFLPTRKICISSRSENLLTAFSNITDTNLSNLQFSDCTS